jgi:hypothetical protein
MTASELDNLGRRLAPLQAAQAEQRKYHQRGESLVGHAGAGCCASWRLFMR